MRIFLVFALLLQVSSVAMASGLFGNNKADDSFAVKSIEGRQAILEGKPKDLKVGDSLYFMRSPFKFTVSSVKGNTVTVTLPESHTLAEGNALLRFPNDAIKKNIQTESRLKQALEE